MTQTSEGWPYGIGDRVVDLTAAEHGWPDVYGEVKEIDGSNVRVKYDSGNERWKMPFNLQKVLQDSKTLE